MLLSFRFRYHVEYLLVHLQTEVQLNVTKDDVQEYFGGDKFQCECVAWNKRGPKRSQMAHVEIACKFP
jgi:hypothetical protein